MTFTIHKSLSLLAILGLGISWIGRQKKKNPHALINSKKEYKYSIFHFHLLFRRDRDKISYTPIKFRHRKLNFLEKFCFFLNIQNFGNVEKMYTNFLVTHITIRRRRKQNRLWHKRDLTLGRASNTSVFMFSMYNLF